MDADGKHYSSTYMEKAFGVFAMYNGLFAACSAADYNYHKALWTLVALEESATAWNASLADVDIEADLLLVAQFAYILETKGADANDYDPDGYYQDCATAGGPVAWTPLTLLFLFGLIYAYRQNRSREDFLD